MTLQQLERKLDGERLLRHVRRTAGSDLATMAIAAARRYSSGTWSLLALARAGHPYRVGGPNWLDPGVVNRQSGQLYALWTTGRDAAGNLTLVNTAPHAVFLLGTRTMIPRPIWQKIAMDLHAPYMHAIINGVEAYWRT